MNPIDDHALHKIVCAVVYRAVLDARDGHEDATRWLMSKAVELYIDESGVDYSEVVGLAKRVLNKVV